VDLVPFDSCGGKRKGRRGGDSGVLPRRSKTGLSVPFEGA
jgi:hypothetical protein